MRKIRKNWKKILVKLSKPKSLYCIKKAGTFRTWIENWEIQSITQRHALSLKCIPSQSIHYPRRISPLNRFNPNSQSQNLMIMITVVQVFKIIWFYSGLTERVSTSEQTQLKFSPCFFPDYKLPFVAKTQVQSKATWYFWVMTERSEDKKIMSVANSYCFCFLLNSRWY